MLLWDRWLHRAFTQRAGSARGHTAPQELPQGTTGRAGTRSWLGMGDAVTQMQQPPWGSGGLPSTPGLRLGAAVAEEAAGGCAALMPLRCGNFLPAGRSRIPPPPLDTERKRVRSCSSALGPGSPGTGPPCSPLVEVVLGVVQPEAHGHRVALSALREDVVHRGSCCREGFVRARCPAAAQGSASAQPWHPDVASHSPSAPWGLRTRARTPPGLSRGKPQG